MFYYDEYLSHSITKIQLAKVVEYTCCLSMYEKHTYLLLSMTEKVYELVKLLLYSYNKY